LSDGRKALMCFAASESSFRQKYINIANWWRECQNWVPLSEQLIELIVGDQLQLSVNFYVAQLPATEPSHRTKIAGGWTRFSVNMW